MSEVVTEGPVGKRGGNAREKNIVLVEPEMTFV